MAVAAFEPAEGGHQRGRIGGAVEPPAEVRVVQSLDAAEHDRRGRNVRFFVHRNRNLADNRSRPGQDVEAAEHRITYFAFHAFVADALEQQADAQPPDAAV